MRIIIPFAATALMVAGTALAARPADPEARLAKAVAGRVAGPPVDCIQLHEIRSSQIIERTAIVYETIGGSLYVNRPGNGAETLDPDDILVTDTHSSQLCSIDVVRLIDRTSGFPEGFVNLGKFVPYRRPARVD